MCRCCVSAAGVGGDAEHGGCACLVGDKVDVRVESIVQLAEEAAAEQLVVRGEPLEAEKFRYSNNVHRETCARARGGRLAHQPARRES